MPKISVADLEQLLESEDDFVDKREILREKEFKNRFKEKIDGYDNVK